MYRTGWNDTYRSSLFPVTIQSRPRSPPSFYSSTSEPSLFSFGCAIPFSKKTPLVPSDPPLCSCGGLQPVSLLPFSLISRPERRRGPRYVWHTFMPASLCAPAAVRTPGSADRPFFQLPPKPDQVHSRCRRSPRASSRNILSGIGGRIGRVHLRPGAPCFTPPFSESLSVEVAIIFRCKVSVQPGAACRP